ncbi:MAG: hypothetical protein AM324_003870 [Candidatus Thorarchaeota archaeon SMTZ1-83]|nr:MAG: hypothetical protein AM324_04985 [Candidatus Thorarchaeota archaeon SMTZ1-83]
MRITGAILACVIFGTWVLVDMYLLSSVVAEFSYPVYELVTYGSWFIVILIILVVCSWSGCFPTRRPDSGLADQD